MRLSAYLFLKAQAMAASLPEKACAPALNTVLSAGAP